MTVTIDGGTLDRAALVRVARGGEAVTLAPGVLRRMAATHEVVERALHEGRAVYGTSTAVGVLKRVEVAEAAAAYSRSMLRTHRVAQGPLAPADLVRGTMLHLLNAYADGTTGVRPDLAVRLERALNEGEVPPVRTLGSIGQADLAPMADLAMGLFADADLAAGEGLALVSSNAFSTAWSALAIADADRLLRTITVAGALSLEGLGANRTLFHPGIGDVRPYPGLRRSLARLGALLAGSWLTEPGAARQLQDPLVFRNLPHLLGTGLDALAFADAQLAIELNASQSNPVVLPGEPAPVSVANYEILPLVTAVDHLRLTLATVITASAERTVKLLEGPWSGLPTGLSPAGGSDPGLAYWGIAVQGVAAEARLLATPVSTEVVSTSHAEGIEDRATMAPLAARKLAEQVRIGERVAAMELATAAQAVDLRGRTPLGAGTSLAHAVVRSQVPGLEVGDTVPDIEPLVERLARDLLPGPWPDVAAVGGASGAGA
ncbi:MAG: aromatic amino acid ammonia-lyase [Chloroflexota bacterium]